MRVITLDSPETRMIVRKIGAKGLFLPSQLKFKRTMIVKDNIFAISIYDNNNDIRIKTKDKFIIDAFKSLFLVFWEMNFRKSS